MQYHFSDSYGALITSCKKTDSSIDYSKFRLKQVIHHANGDSNTTNYSYSGENVETGTIYSTSPATT